VGDVSLTSWADGLAAAQATVACGGDQHRLRWEAGELTALDHDDPDGERALAALGATSCACVEALDAWARYAEDPRVLLLGRRGPTDGIRFFTPDPRAIAPGAKRSVAERERDELLALFALGGGLPDRLVATVAAAWRARLAAGRGRGLTAARPLLDAALYGRLLATLREWMGTSDLELELEQLAEGAPPRIAWTADRSVSAALPFGWLVDVWIQGLAVVAGRLCLNVARDADDGSLRLVCVGPDLEQHELVMQLPLGADL
jgi:hypothetical protein